MFKNQKSHIAWLDIVLAGLGVLLLLSITGCGGGSETQPPISDTRAVTVQIQDAFTGEPVPNASVRIGSQTFTANAQGAASIFVPAGRYSIEISHNGYSPVSTVISCFEGAIIPVLLTPTLSPATDETFQLRSEQVFAAAQNLQRAIDDLKKADASTSRDVTLYLVTAGRAFEVAMRTVSNYTPTRSRHTRGRLDFLSSFLGLLKVSQGTEQTLDIRNRLLAGEDVPEVDQWLAQNPFQGAHSLQELRQMYPGPTIDPVLHRLLIVYEQQNPNSGFHTVMDGAQDIFLSPYPNLLDAPKNLLGEAIDKVWNGAGQLIVKTVDYGSLILQGKKQIAWLWDKVERKLVMAKLENEQPVTLPQTTYDVVISNGSAHSPTMLTDYSLQAASQTVTITPEPIGSPSPGTNVYVGTFTATKTDSNNLGTWQVSVNLTLRVTIPDDPYESPTMKVSGTYNAVRTAVAPGITLDEPAAGSYTFNAQGNAYEGVLQAWDNQLAAGFVQVAVGESIPRNSSSFTVRVSSAWRFGHSDVVVIEQPVTFQRE
jgi:hypothetical protein